MTTDTLFEDLQADALAILQAAPELAGLQVLADDAGDIQARVTRALGTAKDSSGRRGLVIVVMQPEVVETEANLPGPPIVLRLEIRVLENVLRNRNADRGTGVRASVAAVRALSALHHHVIGAHALYGDKPPIIPLETEEGHVEYAVRLRFQSGGIAAAEKPAPVTTEVVAGSGTAPITISGVNYPSAMNGVIPEVTPLNSRRRWQRSAAGVVTTVAWDGTQWGIELDDNGNEQFAFYGNEEDVVTPDLVESWIIQAAETGYPVLAIGESGSTLTLACGTAGASIYYTTDGSYPSPSTGTLYAAPFALPEAGTIVRAAAYKTGLNPGDCLELLITE